MATVILTKENVGQLEAGLKKAMREKGCDAEVPVSADVIDDAAEQPAADPTDAMAQLTDWATRIEAQEREVARLESLWNCAKAEAKAAKENYELGVSTLRRMVREHNDPQRTLPFGTPEETKPAETWRETTLEQLGFSGKILELLTEAKLTTLGAIADYTAEYELTTIKGIGPGKASNIEERLEAWWREHPIEAQQSADEGTEETEQ